MCGRILILMTTFSNNLAGSGAVIHPNSHFKGHEHDVDRIRILGIDPGSRITGWAILECQGRELKRISSGVIRLKAEEPLFKRLGQLLIRSEAIIEQFSPKHVAIEDIFIAKNTRSALLLGEARGVLLAAAGKACLDVYAYPPATVKRAVCGHGRAEKQQIGRMVEVLLALQTPACTDEADAMAVAICHALCFRSIQAQLQVSRALS